MEGGALLTQRVILGKFERDWTFIRQKRPFLARRMRKGNIRQCLLGKNIRHCLVGKIWNLVSEEKWPLKPVDAEEFGKEKKKVKREKERERESSWRNTNHRDR